MIGHLPTSEEILKMGDADGVMSTFQETHSAITVKITCVSLKHYLLFMKEKKTITDEAYKITADTVNRWMFSLRKAVAQQRITVLENNATNMEKNRAAIASYKDSDFAQRATQYLTTYQGSAPDRDSFSLVRDHLLITILIKNGQRSGVACKMTLKEFKSMTRLE